MTIRKMVHALVGVALAAVVAQGANAAELACGKPVTEAQRVQKALDLAEIQNAASLHEYYHSALMHCEEMANVWARKAKDITWTNNTDKYIGEGVDRFYCKGVKQMSPKGALWYHMLTTPVIEVAGDGKTAKGIWMSFGNVSGAMGPGATMSQWTQEKYGIDFIKEDGHWKIWHLRTYVDFYVSTDKSWTDPKANIASPQASNQPQGGPPPGAAPPGAAPPGAAPAGDKKEAGVKEEPGMSFAMMQPDEKGNYYEGYHPDRIPVLAPDLPAPYCTWSEVKAY